ncbi:hypothetical protein [Kineosporia mesophila]|uniref:hypothetical protein n=1 Tax=Kineosporia mesophila TaxID=566012 RepID=UPI001E58B733|nr:hypothetical protein [Kineosporia mesophila]MCD5353713.1 hypothetical protein [Kineosporia mesophila]
MNTFSITLTLSGLLLMIAATMAINSRNKAAGQRGVKENQYLLTSVVGLGLLFFIGGLATNLT